MRYPILALFFLGMVVGCGKQENNAKLEGNDFMVLSVFYGQQAAEHKGLQYQAYNHARLLLDLDLKERRKKKRAVVVDIDETVLDNSRYEAKLIQTGAEYPEYWQEWCDTALAPPVPGSLEFLRYASSKGVEVFYVTNRRENKKTGTLKNLSKMGFPNATEDHVFCRTSESSKESRRQTVAQTHDIVLLMGDNLNDFVDFTSEATAMRAHELEKIRAELGQKFILLPNPMYGDWILAGIGKEVKLSRPERLKKLKAALTSY